MSIENQPGAKTRLPNCGRCQESRDVDKPAMRENGFVGYKCKECNLIYVFPQPDPEDVMNLYGHDSAYVDAQVWIKSSRLYGKRLKAKHALRVIRGFRVSGDLLEIGPGGGAFLREAANYFRVHAAEYNPQQVEYIRTLGYDCRQGAFDEVFQGETFDVIYHCDVLSHLRNPVAEFRAMASLLKPRGIIVFETGNFGDMDERFYPLIECWQYPDHLFFFSQRSLQNLAEAADLKIELTIKYSRVIEMQFNRFMQPVKKTIKENEKVAEQASSVTLAPKAGIKTAAVNFIKNCKYVFDYAAIYIIGRLLPKEGRPQTIIMVMREKET